MDILTPIVIGLVLGFVYLCIIDPDPDFDNSEDDMELELVPVKTDEEVNKDDRTNK